MDQTKSPKRWWKPPSFDDFNVESPTKKIKLEPVKPIIEEKEEDVIRLDVPDPKAIEDLATHPKKVEEVKNWLEFPAADKPRMLLVTGPAGSAKTTTIKVIASSLNYSIKEWINPVDKIDYKEEKLFPDHYDKFNYSENRQIDKFEDFIFRTSRYKSLFEQEGKNLILLEDFPNIFVWKPKQFHDFLEKYQIHGKSPIVFICTDDQNLNLQNDLFPQHVINRFNIHNIKFNPVNNTAMMKVLKKIMEKYSDKANLSQETLENISQNSSGDLRSAISGLAILLIGIKPTKGGGKKTIKKIKGKKMKNEPGLKPVTLKDSNPDFYHAIGRVLYPKKLTDKEKGDVDNKKRILTYNVTDLAEYYSNSFLTLLQENYINTFTSLNDVIDAADLLSTCDLFNGYDDLQNYPALTSVAGLMIKNKTPNKGSFRPLKKSSWTALSKKSNLDKLTHYKDLRLTYRDLELDVVPYMKFLPKCRSLIEYDDLNRLPTNELGRIVLSDESRSVREKPVVNDEEDNMEIEEVD